MSDKSRTSTIGSVFDEMAEQYTSVMDSMVPHYRELIGGLVKYLPAEKEITSVLDLGCGNGHVTALSLARYPEAAMHLVDASPDMIALSKERFAGKNFRYEESYFQDMELTPEFYDLILAGFSLHHLVADEKVHLFTTLFASLREGGILGVADLFVDRTDKPTHRAFMEEWKNFALSNGNDIETWNWLEDHYLTYDFPETPEFYRESLLNAGFSKVDYSWKTGPWVCLHATK